jgi:fatty acyl-CoA reductase
MSIREKLSGKRILITGASGFLGKTLLEKILWEVADVAEIRLMVRPESGNEDARSSAMARILEDVHTSPAFARLRAREERLDLFLANKISVIPCDFLEHDLGMSPEDRDALCRGLDIVIHVAAAVSWDERFDFSVRVNALATRRLAQLAQSCSPAPRFVHISSAYVHGRRTGRVPETAFDPGHSIASELGSREPFDMDLEIQWALEQAQEVETESRSKEMAIQFEREMLLRFGPEPRTDTHESSDRLEGLRKKYVRKRLSDYGIDRANRHGWIDSYTFSKAMAEMFLVRDRGEMSVAIVRPPGITAALQDPDTGWLEGYHLTEPLIEGVGRGLITSFPGRADSVIDTVPVDCVVNLILAVAADLSDSSSPQIYQIATSDVNPVTLGEIEEIWRNYFKRSPLADSKGHPVTVRRARLVGDVEAFVRGLKRRYGMPLSIAEGLLGRLSWARNIRFYRVILGWVVRSRKRFERMLRFSDLYSAYTMNSWRFVSENTRQLLSELSEDDLERFNFDVKRIEWTRFWSEVHIPGMRRYVLKEGADR